MLSERERDILRLIADGLTNRQIADQLFLSLDTVKWYNKRMYSALGVGNRTAAVREATELGLLDPLTPDPAEAPKPRLPAPTTPFIGRHRELAELKELLDDGSTRLISIVAAGGMGKTRLALAAAAATSAMFEQGAYYVPLVQAQSEEDIMGVIAGSLSIPLTTATEPDRQVFSWLSERSTLLLLDNFEHLVGAAHRVTDLLESAAGLKILVTSRERLQLSGEVVYSLGGLELPSGNAREQIMDCSSVELFIGSAKRTRPGIDITDRDLEDVWEICVRVGGMPLGLQLAAGLVDVLSLREIAEEVARDIDILATEMRDVPQRMKSIRAVLDHSWARLSPGLRDVFMQLSVFRSGFTRQAAREIANADIAALRALVGKSLLERETSSLRYVMHELVRQYAEERLLSCGRREETTGRHSRWYLDFAARCGAGIMKDRQRESLDRIEADFDNLRAAWSHAVEHGDSDAVDRALEPLYWYCRMRARVPDGELLLAAARKRRDGSGPTERAVMPRLVLRFDPSGQEYRTLLAGMMPSLEKSGSPRELAFFLWLSGFSAYLDGDFERSVSYCASALTRFRDLDDDFYTAECLHWLSAGMRFLGRVDEVRVLSDELIHTCRRTGNTFALARILGRQGIYAVFEGEDARARTYLDEAISLRHRLGDLGGVATSTVGLGMGEFFNGQFESARRLALDSRSLALETDSPFPKALSLCLQGWLAAMDESYVEAGTLCEAGLEVLSDPNVAPLARFGIAMSECGRARYEQAGIHIGAFLATESPMRTPRGILSMLSLTGILVASEHRPDWTRTLIEGIWTEGADTDANHAYLAVQIFGAVFSHPGSPTGWMTRWPLLERWRSSLRDMLGDVRFEKAWTSGCNTDLHPVLSGISRITARTNNEET